MVRLDGAIGPIGREMRRVDHHRSRQLIASCRYAYTDEDTDYMTIC